MNFESKSGVLALPQAALQYRRENNLRQPTTEEQWDKHAVEVEDALTADGWVSTDEYQWTWVRKVDESDDASED